MWAGLIGALSAPAQTQNVVGRVVHVLGWMNRVRCVVDFLRVGGGGSLVNIRSVGQATSVVSYDVCPYLWAHGVGNR